MPEGEAGTGPLPHISIARWKDDAQYVFPKMKRDARERRTDYHAHSVMLLGQLADALGTLPTADVDRRIDVAGRKRGVLVELETMTPTPQAKATKIPASLEFTAQQIALLRSERRDDRTERAIMFVPDDARAFLKEKISLYGREGLANRDRPDVDKFEVVEAFHKASARDLIAGKPDLQSPDMRWWELWLRRSDAAVDAVVVAARAMSLDVHPDQQVFPDTVVLFVHATAANLLQLADRLHGTISEIRAAAPLVEPLLGTGEHGLWQHALVADYTARLTAPPEGAPSICILDTGVAAAHPLLAPALAGAWAVNAAWGSDDHVAHGGHGTGMAGLIVHGDMAGPLSDSRAVALSHHVESVKFLPPSGFPVTEPPRYGIVTQSAIATVEIERAGVPRGFCIASSTEDLDPDAPSSWSGAIDQIASGAMPGERQDNVAAKDHPKRLVMIATGNMLGGLKADVEQHHSLEDPAQSWNALSIGGYTAKVELSAADPGMTPLAKANHKSPFSRGSQILPPDLTPIKPEVLFEAGNMMVDGADYCAWHPAVSLVTSGKDVANEPLVPFWATSAATGVAGNFVGQLMAALPGYWPETYRALTVHTADWPQPIRSKLIGRGRSWKGITKGAKQSLLREVGFGIPNLVRAVASAKNDITLIAEVEIQPYALTEDGRAVFNAIHFYDLPWPRVVLQALENASVTMKVTLSYFVEPNLSGRAGTRPDTYRSFGLRFALKKRTETARDFRARLSKTDEAAEKVGTETDYWLLGPQAMQAGSLHCDIWRGPAVDLAAHDEIAVLPVGGWWKSHLGQKRVNDKARYALVISISAPDQDVDLYAEVKAEIEARIAAEVTVQSAPSA